jgi:hypothetical protein
MFVPDDRKLEELILYISLQSEGDDRFGSTKLNKVLFYADFIAYVLFGVPITGHQYQKLEHGPAPKAMLPVMERMQRAGDLSLRDQRYFDKNQKRPVALREPDLTIFSGQEIDLVQHLIKENWERNASEISHLSHQFHGWEEVGHRDPIHYEVALIGTRKPTSNEIERGLKLVGKAKHWIATQGNA